VEFERVRRSEQAEMERKPFKKLLRFALAIAKVKENLTLLAEYHHIFMQ
jgi:hypothetical protein